MKRNYIFSVSYSSISVEMWILRRKYHQKRTKLLVSLLTLVYRALCSLLANFGTSIQNLCLKMFRKHDWDCGTWLKPPGKMSVFYVNFVNGIVTKIQTAI